MNINKKRMLALKILMASSILLFLSIIVAVYTLKYKLMAFGLLQWTITVFLNMYYSYIGDNITIKDLNKHLDKTIINHKDNGKYAYMILNLMVAPMVAIGMITLVILTVLMFFK